MFYFYESDENGFIRELEENFHSLKLNETTFSRAKREYGEYVVLLNGRT